MAQERDTYRRNGDLLTGGFVLLVLALFAGFAIFASDTSLPAWAYALIVFIAVGTWCGMIRPLVRLSRETLVLRDMLETVHIPIAAVQEVEVRQLLRVELADDQEFTSTALGRGKGQIRRDAALSFEQQIIESPMLFVEERIRGFAADARKRLGVPERSPEQAALGREVRRDRAWPEIVLLAGSGLVFMVLVFM